MQRLLSLAGPPPLRRDPRAIPSDFADALDSEAALAAVAVALGARGVAGWSEAEEALAAACPPPDPEILAVVEEGIRRGEDPLGDRFCTLRSARERRLRGAVYTPAAIVGAMLDWAERHEVPERVIDPGSGSGRYLLAAGRRFPAARLVGVEIDPLAALLARGNLAAAGLAARAAIEVADFRAFVPGPCAGRTLYLGNPPYVRHHLVSIPWKDWLKREAAALGLQASGLAGLHVHFFLAIARRAAPGDFGALITAAEWLDVNYGRLVRDLFAGPLGGEGIVVIEPTAACFPDAATTAAITTFIVGRDRRPIRFARVRAPGELGDLGRGARVARERLQPQARWSRLARSRSAMRDGFVELGELFRVHRGQVTGANGVWIAGPHSARLPESVLFPAVTRARELFEAGPALTRASALRRVIDLPRDLSILSAEDRERVEEFLRFAASAGAHTSYIARHRVPWWSVGLRAPAPILATYMARRPPAFVRNRARARHINIAHGLYPREPMAAGVLDRLVRFLRGASSLQGGRVYAGGLTKFEPREMERIPVPGPELLAEPA